MSPRRKVRERGMSLIEIIVVIAIGAILVAIIGPTAITANNKAKSNTLQDEFTSVISAFSTLDAGNSSAIHALKADILDGSGNTIMKDYIIEVAPSAAFSTVTSSEVFRRNTNGTKPIVLNYGFNSVTLASNSGYTGTYKHTGDLEAAPQTIGSGTGVVASNLSSQGAVGISPIFSPTEETLLEDFIKSPNGLNWGEYIGQLTGTPAQILAAVFGGPETPADVEYVPYETSPSTSQIVKAPIQLTVVDVDAIEASSSGSVIKTLTDTSKGTLYRVSSIMSRQEFVAMVQANTAVFGQQTDTTLANNLYDRISEGFLIGNPVWIPIREKDIIKSTTSDLKFGFYRP